ncbi:N-acetylglucosaminyldiphosphodolichol N-acetylglucosaminyltransferase [Purpureocillium takamizusanense]|uniref:UDP-N-acetylglucosamine transferase subunit ALG14 n=1 Tax=Purpureocillium takamizusanense TaxID=2060973 RepID=A0A9Q8QQK6_9HYPO|nr:N-acetylglucosaminyldiphosphodolichol N-acetylglucosaminyltransferase [Purpureocillium takamizusanense]UNI24658.1 N-acetylglucosaminyldiphosphodolichol N-acetylglucosaminyltransferase [Purpureocillium takamizusanense]
MGRDALARCGLFAIAAAAGAAVLGHLIRAMSSRTTLLTIASLLILLTIIITVRSPFHHNGIALHLCFKKHTRLTPLQTRHAQILRRRRATPWPKPPFQQHHYDNDDDDDDDDDDDTRVRRHDYFLFVLGSGGHTKEMLMMMDDGFCRFAGSHRRYLISSGDNMSAHHLRDYEAQLAQLCRRRGTSPGSFDTRVVTRARRVHQPLWSTPVTALRSVVDIFPALLSSPPHEAHAAAHNRHRLPTRVFSNGPATGFFVALAVHLLKVAALVPEESMLFVYVESWARISTLSLTGKLLYYTGLADAFYVQHADVAAAYGLVNAGEMVFNARRPDVTET